MDDPGPLGLLPTRDRVTEQPVDERAGGMARRGVDDDPRRLVHDEQVLVLVGDAQVELFWLEGGGPPLRDLHLDQVARRETVALRLRGAVHEHALPGEETLGRRP